MADNENAVILQDSLAKSNFLINAKYDSNINLNKLTYSALFRIQEGDYSYDANNQPVVTMTSKEILADRGVRSSGTIYKELETMAKEITSTSIGYSDPETKTFEYLAPITHASYKDGLFEIKFNADLKKYIMNIQSNFTKLPKAIMMSWKSVYAYRLYEICKQAAYYPKGYSGERNGTFMIHYSLNELRLLIGLVDANLEKVKRVLNKSNPPDYDAACAVVTGTEFSKYEKWSSLKYNVLDRAIKEINNSDLSEIIIEYDTKRYKKSHGEVYAVDFIIHLKEYEREDDPITTTVKDGIAHRNITDEQKFIMMCNISELLEEYDLPFSMRQSILEVADYNEEVVRKAVAIMKNNRTQINNVGKWLISAIKCGYEMEQKTDNGFNNIEEQEYDFAELERMARNKV